jgi:hypothetical protein
MERAYRKGRAMRSYRFAARLVTGVALLCAAGAASGCASSRAPKDYTPTWGRFFLEAANNADGTPLSLPRSGVNLTVNSKPVITESDVVNVELVQVDLGKCLMFQLTPTAARDLYRLTGSHQGRRLALVINDAALGARRIDGPISDGVVFVFVEVPDEELPALVQNLKKSSIALQAELKRKA